MPGIVVYNLQNESHENDKNDYQISRPSILGNPYTHLPVKNTLAIYQCKTRDEAIKKYSDYFDIMYGKNLEFTKIIDEIYDKYKGGETIYLGCWCHPMRCHGDVIAEKLQKRLIKEKLTSIKRKKDEKKMERTI